MKNKPTRKPKLRRPALTLNIAEVEAMFDEDYKRLAGCLKFFEITNRASFEIALAVFQMGSDFIGMTDFTDHYREQMTRIQDDFLQQIKDHEQRLRDKEEGISPCE